MVERNEDNIYKVSLFGYVVFLKKKLRIFIFVIELLMVLVIEDICFIERISICSLEMSNR